MGQLSNLSVCWEQLRNEYKEKNVNMMHKDKKYTIAKHNAFIVVDIKLTTLGSYGWPFLSWNCGFFCKEDL